MTTESTNCPRCGNHATGNFCASCGARLSAASCGQCGTAIAPGAAFCHGCGAPASGPAGSVRPVLASGNPTAWLLAAVLVVITIASVVYLARNRNAPQPANMANAGNAGNLSDAVNAGNAPCAVPTSGPAPDISKLTAKERFARLNDKVMAAAEKGDSTSVICFWPMTLGAYENLGPAERDVDARYHMATLYLMLTQLPQAMALSDTILKESPNNLFGYYVRAMTNEYQGDSTAMRASQALFVKHYPAEIKKQLTEYLDHRPILDRFYQDAGGK